MRASLVAFAVSAGLSAAFVFLRPMRGLLLRSAAGDRWRSDAVPVAGGLAMGIACLVAVSGSLGDPVARAVVVAGAIALVWGLVDDVAAMRPLVKVVGQAAAGGALVALGVRIPTGGGDAVEAVVTVVWVVVVANAMNLLDNMDGAAAGVGLVAAATVWWWWGSGGSGPPAVLPAAVVGALAGYLVFNVRPARLFMGDSGSLWLGVTLAGLVAADGGGLGSVDTPASPVVLLVSSVLLVVPLFDTALVAVERRRHGRPISQGGQDHTAHRLVARGLTPGSAVAVLWGLAAGASLSASALRLGEWWLLAAAVALAALLGLLAVWVARAEVY